MTNDVIETSAIEGEILNSEEVRSSVGHRLGIEQQNKFPKNQDIEGIVDITLDATQKFSNPLTKERLFGWHAVLFPTSYSGMNRITVGKWRKIDDDPMQVVSGPEGNETIHFEAPGANRLESEMKDFLQWFNKQDKNLDPILKAGIAHLWFVTIHPFDDGNGRIARAICDMAMSRACGVSERFYSLSSQLMTERKDYYKKLERQQRGTADITEWLEWFLDCLGRAISNADVIIEKTLSKAKLWEHINQYPISERQRIVINRMLETDFEGYMNTSKYAKLSKCSTDTALRDIQDLKKQGIFIQNPGQGRSTSYRLRET